MRCRSLFCSILVLMFAAMAVTPAFSEETDEPAVPDASQSKDLSVYGEIQSVNTFANSVTIQYYDYDTDEEKTSEIMLDKNTRLENAAALGEINKGDWADITYSAGDGKSTARVIAVEKETMEPEDAGSPVPPAEEE
ncbi:MAG: hypothetical protein WC515_06015 [Candidatus Omnitrophota bacterium]